MILRESIHEHRMDLLHMDSVSMFETRQPFHSHPSFLRQKL